MAQPFIPIIQFPSREVGLAVHSPLERATALTDDFCPRRSPAFPPLSRHLFVAAKRTLNEFCSRLRESGYIRSAELQIDRSDNLAEQISTSSHHPLSALYAECNVISLSKVGGWMDRVHFYQTRREVRLLPQEYIWGRSGTTGRE